MKILDKLLGLAGRHTGVQINTGYKAPLPLSKTKSKAAHRGGKGGAHRAGRNK